MDTTFLKHDEQRSENIIAWRLLLKEITLEQIHNQFEEYKLFCHNYSTSFNLIEEKVNSLFSIDYMGSKFPLHFKFAIDSENHSPDFPHYFFRIRKMKGEVYIDDEKQLNYETLEFKDIQTINDVWEKPADIVTSYQRLSKPLNTVLYTSLMSSTAILELRLKPKDLFFLMIYKDKRRFKFSDCCRFIYFNQLTEEENLKRYVMFNLLRDEFTRVLPENYREENQYCIAYSIAKRFFIEESVDAIQYPSCRGLGHQNFAFFEDHVRDNLEFVGLRACGLSEQKGTSANIIFFADGFWNEELNKFEYYSPYSDKSKLIFTQYLNIMMSK